MPGMFLNYLHSSKFKTGCLSIALLSQLDKETASLNALTPYVLRRGTTHYPDMEAISNKLDEMFGATIDPIVRRTGEIQSVGFYSSFPENSFLPEGSNIIGDVISLVSEMLLNPVTRGGLLKESYVDSEKKKLADIIRSRINEKRSYSVTRCAEEMCSFEAYSVGRFGSAEDCESINYKKLTKQYHNLLSECPVEIFYCGNEKLGTVSGLLSDAFSVMPRGTINYDMGTDIRINTVEEQPRYCEENLDVTQGKLVLGYRLGEIMDDLDRPSLMVFNAVFGSGVTSKLFMNVREKLSLCYYASSVIDRIKGIMLVASGIDFCNYEVAKDEIIHQLEDVKCGNITDDELMYAKRGIISDLNALNDNPYDLESFYFSNILEGSDYSPDDLKALVETVTKEDVEAVAGSVALDLIYFLRNETDAED